MTEHPAPGITRFEVTSSVPYGTFDGKAFARIEGRVTGELAADAAIAGLARAARNARGRVEYSAPFVLVVPRKKGGGNGALLVDVPNRGRPITHHLYNSPRAPFVALNTFDVGNAFLQTQGFGVAMLQWELGYGIDLPTFQDDEGRTRYVEGAGVAAIRDFTAFLRHAEKDSTGAPNPVHGFFERCLVTGYSQTARLLKRMLVDGLDLVQERRVFDAMHVHASAAGLANVQTTGTGPESGTSVTPRFADPQVRGVTEEPLTYADIVAHAAAHAPGVPKLLVTNMGTDYLSLRASLARTGAQGTTEAPIPTGVRLYDVAGASHSRNAEATCQLPPGQLDFFPVLRATLLNLDAWVRDGTAPPDSRLMPLAPRPGDETVLQAPAHLPHAVVQTPPCDTDGNAIGGVRLPDMEAPLGIHGAQNRPLTEVPCNLTGAYVAFARPALRERYPDRAVFVARIRAAAQRLVADRFMLAADAMEVERAAEAALDW